MGTTGVAAEYLDRECTLVERKPEVVERARARLNTDSLPSPSGQNDEAAWQTFDALREPFGGHAVVDVGGARDPFADLAAVVARKAR